MTKQDSVPPELDQQFLVDRLYEIALNPDTLESFIDLWEETNALGATPARDFDRAFGTHLERAEQFLKSTARPRVEWADILEPYQSFAAFIVDPNLKIAASNRGASTAFGAVAGLPMDQLNLTDDTRAGLQARAKALLPASDASERSEETLIATHDADQRTLLFRLQRLVGPEGQLGVLIVSTWLHWRDSTNTLLQECFGLTEAERHVTRGLTEGRDVRDIASQRGTSTATVRGQIKAITRKLQLRSQADIVQFVMALTAIQTGVPETGRGTQATAPVLTGSALEAEFGKPFQSVDLPDGRCLAYHEMGPPGGHPVLFSHMGSCMVRWSRQMLRLAFRHNLRVICPMRAGFGQSDPLPRGVDVLHQVSDDTIHLLRSLGVGRLPFAVQGSDFPFATALAARFPSQISEVLAVGGRPCLPGGAQVEARGRWQKFFVSAARNNPKLLQFASSSVMAMSRRVGHETMLRRLCKDSPSDLACLEIPDIKEALIANIAMMANGSPHIGRAFAAEYIAFQQDWSGDVFACKSIPIQVFVATEDPTIDLDQLPALQQAYPWIRFEQVEQAGLALMFQHYRRLIPAFAKAAKTARAA